MMDDGCYPLEMIIKIISDEVAYWSKEFHSLKINTLNYPDLNKELIRRWIELCDNRDNEKLLQELFDKLSNFCNSVVNKARDLNFEEVEGVSLFRK
jgi:hypothetical protein